MARFALIIPACNEAAALALLLPKLRETLDSEDYLIVVGANDCSDDTAAISRAQGVLVAETERRGYGHGCQVAIDLAKVVAPALEAFIFFAADGANDPRDILKLVAAYEDGSEFVLGQRTRLPANWKIMNVPHIFANRFLGFWCGMLTGRFYCDLGPLRLISRALFDRLDLREWTYGWTIEPQILVARLGLGVAEIDVAEYPRIAGEQKVSQVNWRRTIQIGGQILAAGWRARFRRLPYLAPCPTPYPPPSLV